MVLSRTMLVGAAIVLWFAAVFATVARADAVDDALAGFTSDRFPDVEHAINALMDARAPNAAATLDALRQGALLYDPATKKVYIAGEGDLIDAKTGAPAPGVSAAKLKKPRLNNAIRARAEAATGQLALVGPDPEKRRAAAEALFGSSDPNALARLDAALATEQDPAARSAMTQARAAIVMNDAARPEPERLAAIQVLRARGDSQALGALSGVAASGQGRVQAAAVEASKSIERRMALWASAQNVWYGLSLGSVLLLAAIGLAITFGVMGVINMAHGEMVMLGAYSTYVVQEWIRTSHPSWFDYSLFVAIPLAFVVTGAAGILIERTIIRFLYGRPLETLLATFGLSLVLQQAVRVLFGPDNRQVGAPAFMAGSFNVGGLAITSGRLWIILFSLLVFALLQVVLRATPFGLRMRAVTQNRRMASAMGIDVNRIDALAFGLGSGVAGIAGVALSQIDNVSPNLGQSYIVDSFMVVVFGGVGNLWGTLVGAMTLGVANKLLEPFAGAVLAKIAVLVFIILFIQKRPRGLFAQKGRTAEA